MKLTDIDDRTVRLAVAAQAHSFHTRDVSEYPAMLAAHDSGERAYHMLVGKHLRAHADQLGIRFVNDGNTLGALWEKLAASSSHRTSVAAAISPATTATTVFDDALDLGPQYERDSAFVARMRLHQSWYRAAVLREPFGADKGATSLRGSQLTPDAGDRGRNFLTSEIFDVARRRAGDPRGTLDRDRLFRNMLSSQPMVSAARAPS